MVEKFIEKLHGYNEELAGKLPEHPCPDEFGQIKMKYQDFREGNKYHFKRGYVQGAFMMLAVLNREEDLKKKSDKNQTKE